MENNKTNYTVYINGVAMNFLATNKFHALNRARKMYPTSKVSLNGPVNKTAYRNTSRIETTYRGNGRSFSVMVMADGTTWDLD